MSAKRDLKLVNIAQRLRRIQYRIKNFFYYRLLVTSKHLLIVGGGNTELKNQIIKNFSDTWRIANIDYTIPKEHQEKCQLNYQLNSEQNYISNLQISEIDEQIQKFSKHYECVLCLPEKVQKTALSNQDVFENYTQAAKTIIQPNILAGYLSSKYLTTNGIVILKGEQKSFEQGSPDDIVNSICMNQSHFMNLSLGDRDDLSTDAYSISLLERESQDWNNNTEITQLTKQIRTWAEGNKRPVSGTFIKFHDRNNKIYPEYI